MTRLTAIVLIVLILVAGGVVLLVLGKGEGTAVAMIGAVLLLLREAQVQFKEKGVEHKARTKAEAKAQDLFETTQTLTAEKLELEAKLAKRNTKGT